MLKGNVYEVRRTCGNKQCKCYTGDKHTAYQLTYKGKNNITKTVYVSQEDVKAVKKYISNYNKAKAAFDKIVDLNIKFFKSKGGT